jgi:hypothetical protein
MTVDNTLNLARVELKHYLSQEANLQAEFHLNTQQSNITKTADRLIFSAPNSLEILYLVYALAENFLGYCFFQPGNDIFTSDLKCEIPDGMILQLTAPRLKRRGFIQEFPFSDDSRLVADWMVKNRLNYLLVWMKYYDDISPELKEYFHIRGIEIESGHHNFDYWIPLKKYAATHPEYFAVVNGERAEYDSGDEALLLSKQLCTTNPQLRQEIVKNMIAYCQTHPEIKTISLIPNDGFGWCECEHCKRFYDKNHKGELYNLSQHVYKADRIYHDLFKEVAGKLTAALPDINITLCAYVNYSAPADGFKLNRCQAVHFAPYWRCVNHHIYDATCPINRHYINDLKQWVAAKNGGEVNIYEYLMGVNLYVSLPLIFHEAIFDEIEWYQKIGVDGFLTQFNLSHWTVYGMNFYAMAKAAAGADKQQTLQYLFKTLFYNNTALGIDFYNTLKQLVNAGTCHITYPRALFNRTQIEQYQKLHKIAQQLLETRSNNSFCKKLVIWTEYLLRFKKLFDLYHSENIAIENIIEFKQWIFSYPDSDIFVYDKIDLLLNAWIEALENNKKWLHFNLNWEDRYIEEHDSL